MAGVTEAASDRFRQLHDGLFLRVLHPSESYWERSFSAKGALYRATPEVAYLVVEGDHRNLLGQWPEIMWLYPEEVRLLAAVALAVPEGRGKLPFVPVDDRLRLDETFRTDAPTEWARLDHLARDEAERLFGTTVAYQLREADGSPESFQSLVFRNVELANPLMVRGLITLLKSQHIFRTSHLLAEDATVNIQISREAALELIRDRLRPAVPSPSFADAHDYLREHFVYGDALADYFAKQHELWLTAKHPKTRLGMFWTPPFSTDDFFETYEALVSVYRHLLSGEAGRETAFG